MESLAIIFVLGICIALFSQKDKKPPEDPWKKLGIAVEDALHHSFPDLKIRERKKKKENNEFLWVLFLWSLFGAIVLFGA
jgi:hypothetical protein